jgi:hypothetical protein
MVSGQEEGRRLVLALRRRPSQAQGRPLHRSHGERRRRRLLLLRPALALTRACSLTLASEARLGSRPSSSRSRTGGSICRSSYVTGLATTFDRRPSAAEEREARRGAEVGRSCSLPWLQDVDLRTGRRSTFLPSTKGPLARTRPRTAAAADPLGWLTLTNARLETQPRSGRERAPSAHRAGSALPPLSLV